MTKLVRPCMSASMALWMTLLGTRVDVRGSLVEDERGTVREKRAGDRHKLALALGEVRALLVDARCHSRSASVWDEVVGERAARARRLDLGVRGVGHWP